MTASLVTPDALYVVRAGGSTHMVEAHPLRPGGPRWMARSAGGQRVALCGGGLLCAMGAEGLTVLDPADGKVRWSSARWQGFTGDIMLDGGGRAVRIDFSTGRIERNYGRGAPIGDLMLFSQLPPA